MHNYHYVFLVPCYFPNQSHNHHKKNLHTTSSWAKVRLHAEIAIEVTGNDMEEAMEVEIASECGQQDSVVLERLLRRDMMMET